MPLRNENFPTRFDFLESAPKVCKVLLCALLLGHMFTLQSFAQEHEFLKRGATQESLSSVDSVNLSNGAGVINVPIGSPVQIGGGLSFGLNLFYNSKIWDTESSRYTSNIDPQTVPIIFPSRKSRAGVGWSLSLGELIPPGGKPLNTNTSHWLYIDASGGNHLLYAVDGDDRLAYSRDSSYIRMREITGERHIEFPSGEVHVFGVDHRLVRIFNQFEDTNALAVTYPVVDGLDVIRVTDSHGRVWEIHTEKFILSYPGGDPIEVPEVTLYTVDKVVVPGFGHPSAKAVYQFHYEEREVFPGCAWHDYNENARILMPQLDRIDLPPLGGEELSWAFKYYEDSPTNYTKCRQGLLDTVKLPSGGRIRWDYVPFESRPHCDDEGEFRFFWSRSAVIARREYYDVGDGLDEDDLLAQWSYLYRESEPPNNAPNVSHFLACEGIEQPASETLTVRELTPTGDLIFHPFMVWPHGGDPGSGSESEHGATTYDYFLPYIRRGIEPRFGPQFSLDFFTDVAPAQDGEGRFLSQVVFDCEGNMENCTPFSARYVAYESSVPGDLHFVGQKTDRNDRLISEKTVYFESGIAAPQTPEGYEVITDSSEFDGLGNFRRVETRSTFPGESPLRIFTRDYNSHLDLGLLGFAGSGSGGPGSGGPGSHFSFPDIDAWILNMYSVTTLEEAGEASVVETLFDTETGFLERERVWALVGPTPGSLNRSSNDILTIYEHEGDGNISAISTYGGDLQQNLQDVDLDGSVVALHDWEYRKENDYQYGFLTKQSQVTQDGGSLILKDVDIDKNTGLPTTSRDATGLETLLDYDAIGRLTSLTPPDGAATVAERLAHTLTTGEVITLRRSSGGDVLEERFVQDGFRRNVLEEVKFPQGRWSATEHIYGKNGLLAETSTPFWRSEGSSSAGKTFFRRHDPKGRPLETEHPDGKKVHLKIDREHSFETTMSVATGATEINVPTWVRKDSRGRILEVEELSGADAAPVITSYLYDVGGRLSQVSTPMAGGGTQERSFLYDNRGYLLSEAHPETGTITHRDYDTAGHAGTRIDAVHQLGFVHDEFGRQVQVWDEHKGRLLSEAFYSRENRAGGTDRSLGKVVTAKRHNYLEGSGDHVVITETYAYEDGRGLMSELRTRSNTGFNVGQTFEYDAFGNLLGQGYPLQDLLPEADEANRFVEYVWDQSRITGFSTALNSDPFGDVITGMSYHPHGLVASRVHANGVTDLFTVDPSGMARPERIKTMGVAGGEDWDSGVYSYDGAGNIKAIGSTQAFIYDEVMRLRSAVVDDVDEAYEYDRFGNMLQLGDRSFPVDPLTNRFFPIDPETSQSTGFAYDGVGNLISSEHWSFTYDAGGMASSTADRRFAYGVGNERISIIESDGRERWTVRDPQHRLLREYSREPGRSWVLERDYLYGDRLIASESFIEGSIPETQRHYHSDHLGSPRLISDGEGGKVSEHTYLPFGEEIEPIVDDERLKFTGHERDASDLDYMHARFYGPLLGRFTGVDPVLGQQEIPQSWNRYAYVRNNPMHSVDPDGRFVSAVLATIASKAIQKQARDDVSAQILGTMASTGVEVAYTHGVDTGQLPDPTNAISNPDASRFVKGVLGVAGMVDGGASVWMGAGITAASAGAGNVWQLMTSGWTVGTGGASGLAGVALVGVPLAFGGGYLLGSGFNSLVTALDSEGMSMGAHAYNAFAAGENPGPDGINAAYSSIYGRPVTNAEALAIAQEAGLAAGRTSETEE